jgi:hypothetical protein
MSPLLSCPTLRPQPSLLSAGCLRFPTRSGFRNIFRFDLFFLLAAGGANSWAQTWISAVSATTTANTAKVTWTTAVPADSQVEYGTTASYGSVTALAAAKVAIHSVALSGLTGGTTYHFRVRSSDASGALVVGPDYSLLISIPLTVLLSPLTATIAAKGTQQFTATVSNNPNHAVTWSATAGTVSSSGLFTAPAVSTATSVDITATSQADTTKTASVTLQIGVAPNASTMLLGHSILETKVNGLYGGMAEGYQMTAAINGTVTTLSVYIDSATTATKLFVGLYGDNNGHPGTRLTGGSSTAFQKTAWNTIPVPPVSVAAGKKYWFVLLGTGGVMKFRQKPIPGAWIDELNSVRTLTSLPAAWTTGTIYTAGAFTSVYASGVTSSAPVGTPTPILSVSPTGLNWTAKVGTSNLAPGSVSVTNAGTGSLTFASVSDQPWLAISLANGTAPASVQIMPSGNKLAAGTYTGHVMLTGGGITKTVTVVLSMTAPPPVQRTVSLSWHAPTTGNVVSYSMYRSSIEGSSYGLLASAIGGTTYVDQGPQSGTPYYYVVTAVDSEGRESPYSNEIPAAIP